MYSSKPLGHVLAFLEEWLRCINSGGYSYIILEDIQVNLAKLINFKYSFCVPEGPEPEMRS